MPLAHRVIQLSAPADTARLQRLLERCSDSFELHEGWPTPADAAECELTVVPPTSTPDDLRVLAVEDDGGTLHAMVSLLRDYPQAGSWWIGLLVVAPELRGRGMGAALFRHALETATDNGAAVLQLVVSLRNPRAQAFWEAAGFRDTGKTSSVTSRSGHIDVVRILERVTASR